MTQQPNNQLAGDDCHRLQGLSFQLSTLSATTDSLQQPSIGVAFFARFHFRPQRFHQYFILFTFLPRHLSPRSTPPKTIASSVFSVIAFSVSSVVFLERSLP